MKHLQHPIVAEPHIQYVVKSKLGFVTYTFEGINADGRAKAYIRDRPNSYLALVKRTLLEEEIAVDLA